MLARSAMENPRQYPRLTAELGAMLDAYDAARSADELRKRRVADEEAAFLAGFAELRGKVVRPVFKAAGALLAARGHGFSIREEEFAAGRDGHPREASIVLTIAPAGMEGAAAADMHLRELSLTTRHYNKQVALTNGALPQSGAMAGPGGGYTLAQIDASLLEEHLLKLVRALIGG